MTSLYPHQKKALDDTAGFDNVAYYLDMGLGKTYVGAEKMIQIGNTVNLIVCQKSKIEDWCKHLCEHYRSKYLIFDLTDKDQFEGFFKCWEHEKIGVINYELAWRRKGLLYLKDFTLMLDESSLIQNQKAKQTKFILKMKPKNVILLSGTPTAGKYENLWSQINLLGWSISEKVYNTQYVNWTTINAGGFKHKVVDKSDPYKNVERLKRKLREHGAVFMKTEEAFTLPEQIEVPVVVPSSKEYRKFCKDKVLVMDTLNLKEFVETPSGFGEYDATPTVELIGDTQLTERLCKRQLCGMYSKEKLDAFRNLVESTRDRLIVFYNFNHELERLKGILKSMNRPVSVVNGSEKDLTAYEQESDSVTLIQYQAGAMGLNLQKANKIIYFTIPDKSELFEQSKKRIHRIGQEKTCFYYFLLVRNSVETNEILPTLKVRKEWSDELFKDN
jgi:SNF2 family DNA or RNA helicase